jgi:hypothetical protein
MGGNDQGLRKTGATPTCSVLQAAMTLINWRRYKCEFRDHKIHSVTVTSSFAGKARRRGSVGEGSATLRLAVSLHNTAEKNGAQYQREIRTQGRGTQAGGSGVKSADSVGWHCWSIGWCSCRDPELDKYRHVDPFLSVLLVSVWFIMSLRNFGLAAQRTVKRWDSA